MPRAKQRTPELRERVLAVAVDLLSHGGMSGFTTRQVAERAGTSLPAVYELFTDKDGLVHAVYLEGFRRLGRSWAALPETDSPLRDLEAKLTAFRHFCLDYPALARVMFSRPFRGADGDGRPRAATAMTAEPTRQAPTVRDALVTNIERCVAAGLLQGHATDVAHAVLALAQGLAVQEGGGWLGSSPASVDRRWQVGLQALLRGFAPGG